jgi:DNA mismatch endonuclease (patch repair protein)
MTSAQKRKDPLTSRERSRRMSLVRAKDTKPEMRVRKLLHSLRYRYRLHDRTLPGCPDLVFKSLQKVIFVHGCFWHQHNCPMGNRMPKSNLAFWKNKLEGNQKRDAKNHRQLRKKGWSFLVIWECQTKITKINNILMQVNRFLKKS